MRRDGSLPRLDRLLCSRGRIRPASNFSMAWRSATTVARRKPHRARVRGTVMEFWSAAALLLARGGRSSPARSRRRRGLSRRCSNKELTTTSSNCKSPAACTDASGSPTVRQHGQPHHPRHTPGSVKSSEVEADAVFCGRLSCRSSSNARRAAPLRARGDRRVRVPQPCAHATTDGRARAMDGSPAPPPCARWASRRRRRASAPSALLRPHRRASATSGVGEARGVSDANVRAAEEMEAAAAARSAARSLRCV